jgi:RNB domain
MIQRMLQTHFFAFRLLLFLYYHWQALSFVTGSNHRSAVVGTVVDLPAAYTKVGSNPPTSLLLARNKEKEESSASSGVWLEDILIDYGWEDRVIRLSKDCLPRFAEIQHDGSLRLGMITDMEFNQDPEKPPKLIADVVAKDWGSFGTIEVMPSVKIDLGQLTTLWPAQRRQEEQGNVGSRLSPHWSTLQTHASTVESIPLNQVDELLDRLYETSRPDQGTAKRGSWTKKDLQKIIDQIPTTVSFAQKELMEATLRHIAKAGPRHTHLIDSDTVLHSLHDHSDHDFSLPKRAQVVNLLGEHGSGRFKRFPSLFLSSDPASGIVQIINGGWIAVDSAVRASKEGKALATTGASRGTNADERIVQRLEYLAMSGSSSTASRRRNGKIAPEELQVDVREYLKALDLPCTSQGAKQALVDLGLWTSLDDGEAFINRQSRPQPWPSEILQAVEWYRTMDSKRKKRLAQNLFTKSATYSKPTCIEGRVDLTHLPCICVDAARTTFRDDAIGVRPRSSTGRNVIKSGKWEILLHTADVSDLYAPAIVERSEQLQLLQSAASKRGASRYDLQSGPLHLLPPSLLESLALEVVRSGDPPARATLNRCTTTWVYIDESSGEILDAGMERTLISPPMALTFQSASGLLEDGQNSASPADVSGEALKKTRTLLKLIERAVLAWKDREQQRNASASKAREDRLVARQQIDELIYGNSNTDDGRDGFKRTRGHRLVDGCLDLQGVTLSSLVRKANHSLPFVAGAQRDGRVATAPLRRYIDGVAQWQALAVLVGYGGKPYSKQECAEIGLRATKAVNAVSNIQAFRQSTAEVTSKASPSVSKKQLQAARALKYVLSTTKQDPVAFPAVSTGKQSEVVLVEFGAVAFCEGVQGTLRPGEKITVSIRDIDLSSGRIRAVSSDLAGREKPKTGKARMRRKRTPS